MKSTFTKFSLCLGLVLCIVAPKSLQAQDYDFDFADLLKAPQADLETYMSSYVGPGMISFANGLAGGWYNTAKPHKPLGFDITGSVSIANIPDAKRLFTFDPADYQIIQLTRPATQLPTLVGGGQNDLAYSGLLTIPVGASFVGTDGVTYSYSKELNFDAPYGFDPSEFPIAGAPVPSLQLGLGIFKNTDLKFRYGFYNDDKIGIDFDVIGFAIMHDIKQWIPGIKQLPIDISLLFGTTKMTLNAVIDEAETDFTAKGVGKFEARATTYQLLISKKLSFFTPYFGIGVNSVSTSIAIEGDFTLNDVTDLTGNSYNFQDPLNLSFSDGGGLRSTLGFRLALAILTLHADYTIQESNILTLGVGISVR